MNAATARRSRSTATRRTSSRASAAAARRAQARRRRRRVTAIVVAAIAGLALVYVVTPGFHHAVREIALPLRHEDIIRQQARDKGLDPALIAGVIYAESHFRDGQTSSAGAQGLMQLTPATASSIAQKSGGVAFTVRDLGTPQVNIAYGAYYLRYLLRRYHDNASLALAAYNGGEGNVDRWIARAGRSDGGLQTSDIPFPETRAYVRKVLDARKAYRLTYGKQLGPASP